MKEKADGQLHGCKDCLCERAETTRRAFLRFTGGAIAAGAIAVSPLSAKAAQDEEGDDGIGGYFRSIFGICRTPELDQSKWSRKGNEIRIQKEAFSDAGGSSGAVYLDGKGLDVPVLILRSEDGRYHAFSNKCTHMGRKLDPVRGKEVLRCCSVSHATFDYQGNVIGGPAKGPITLYEAVVVGDEIVIRG